VLYLKTRALILSFGGLSCSQKPKINFLSNFSPQISSTKKAHSINLDPLFFGGNAG